MNSSKRIILIILGIFSTSLYSEITIDTKGLNDGIKTTLDNANNYLEEEKRERKARAASSSSSYNTGNTPSITTNSSSGQGKATAYVTDVKQQGNYTIVKCSVGNDTKIYHDKYGTCSDNYIATSGNPCSWVMKKARERCNKR